MGIRKTCTGAVLMLVAVTTVGAVGVETAAATGPAIGVTPTSGLSEGSTVHVTVSGATPTALGQLFIAECGNAYANGTALPATVDTSKDCTTIGWIYSPFAGQDFVVKQTGIGSGNRSCVLVANRPCHIYAPSGINVSPLPTPPVNISFASNPTGGEAQPSPTTTTLLAVGSPVATGKAQHALVHVIDGAFAPDGTVTITEGATTVGTGGLTNGVADVVLGPSLGLGTHSIVAHYPGDGSFVASVSSAQTFKIIDPNNISIGDASIVSGTGGTRSLVFPVVLSKPPGSTVTIPYSFVPGTATAGVDYVGIKSTAQLTFKPGPATLKNITVKLKNDVPSTAGFKTFTVHLATPTAGTYVLRDADGTGTIFDPGAGGATVSVGDVSMPEGDVGGAHAAKFAVTLSAVPTQVTSVTVNVYTRSTQSALKGAKGVGDYNSRYQFVLTFTPGTGTKVGATTKFVGVPIWADNSDELDEAFSVDLSNVVSNPLQPVSLGRHVATGVILSDE